MEPPASEPTGRGGLLRRTPGKTHCEWHASPVNRDGEPFIGVPPSLGCSILFRQLARGQATNRRVVPSCMLHSTVCRSGGCKRGQIGSGDQTLTYLVRAGRPRLQHSRLPHYRWPPSKCLVKKTKTGGFHRTNRKPQKKRRQKQINTNHKIKQTQTTKTKRKPNTKTNINPSTLKQREDQTQKQR